jgi:hypothetical protein
LPKLDPKRPAPVNFASLIAKYSHSLIIREIAVARAPVDMEGRPTAGAWRAGLLMALAVIGLALLQTHPLWRFLGEGIPYGYRVVPGYELVPDMPGDHLQFLYWCWLLVDNLFGPSALFSNPYEFNTFLTPFGLPGFANFPFSILYVILSPLGQAPAYNGLVLISYLLAGLAAYGLAAEVLKDRVAALPAGIIFALLPFRAAQVLSGHLYGFVAFLLPLMLYCLERGWRQASWLWGAGAGACLVAMGWMEPHLVYYSALFVGLYVPLRLLVQNQEREPQTGGYIEAVKVAIGAVGAGIMAQVAQARQGGDFLGIGLVEAFGIYLVLFVSAWLLLSWLTASLTILPLAKARRILAKGFMSMLLLALYAIQLKWDVPYLGSILLGLNLLLALFLILPGIWPHFRKPKGLAKLWLPVLPLAVGLGLAAGRMLLVKASSFDQSIAGKGRGLHEVMLFTPSLSDLLNLANVHMEKLVHLGWGLAGLSVLGLILLAIGLPRPARQAAQAAVWAFLGAVATLLALGPTVKAAPLYELLYKVVPFFNFPRVPGRLIIFAVLMLSLLAGWAIRELSGGLVRKAWLSVALCLALLLGFTYDLGLPARTGISLLPQPGTVTAGIQSQMKTGPGSPQRLLGLPIWPGDSHQSSVYEHTISLTRAQMVNGYSPVVPQSYVKQVFQPLDYLNFGLVNQAALQTLDKLKVRLVSFHDNDLVYAAKISPFPPAFARQRLIESNALDYVTYQGNVVLMSLKPEAAPDAQPGRITSPVVSLWEAEALKHETGQLKDDKQASGWGLLFDERPLADPTGPLGPRRRNAPGNVVMARAGRDKAGFISFGPYKAFAPGKYLARFRLRRTAGDLPISPGWVEVSTAQGTVSLAKADLDDHLLPPDGNWHDVPLEFELRDLANLELRTWFNGKANLDLDLVLVGFKDGQPKDGFYRAQDMWRQTGDLISDQWVTGGLAVQAEAGHNPPLYMMHGPQVTLEPGRYLASFRLAGTRKARREAPAADLVVATDRGRLPLAFRRVRGSELKKQYQDFTLAFEVKRRMEIGLRVRFAGGADVRLAGAGLLKPDRAK